MVQFHPFVFAGVYYCFEMTSSFLIGCYQIVGFPEFLAATYVEAVTYVEGRVSFCEVKIFVIFVVSIMASYHQEDELVNFYGSGMADVNEEDEEMIDITTEVRCFEVSIQSTRY